MNNDTPGEPMPPPGDDEWDDYDPGYDPWDDWWAKHEREEAEREAASHTPKPPDPDDQPEYVSPEEQIEGALLKGSAILDIPPPEPLLGGWLNLDSMAVMYGPPKKGKSFVAIDMAMCVAAGRRWHNMPVEQGPVLYVIAEGVRGIGPRVRAWAKVNTCSVPDNLIWLPRAVNLLNDQWSSALSTVAGRLQPVLVVIDTLNRSMVGGDENSSKDMGVIVQAADLIKRSTGACVLIIHHSGKDVAAGARGHSSLLGALDTELEVKAADGIIILSNTAQKDSAECLPMRFTLEAAPGTESVAIATYRGSVSGDGKDLSKGCAEALEVLREIQTPGGVPPSRWESVGSIPHSSFYRYVPRLLELGLISNVGTDKQPRYLTFDADDAEDAE